RATERASTTCDPAPRRAESSVKFTGLAFYLRWIFTGAGAWLISRQRAARDDPAPRRAGMAARGPGRLAGPLRVEPRVSELLLGARARRPPDGPGPARAGRGVRRLSSFARRRRHLEPRRVSRLPDLLGPQGARHRGRKA